MVYIDKKYPSQQGSVKKGFGEAFSLASQITMIIQVVCFIIMCVKVDSAMANSSMESLKYLWDKFMVLILVQFLTFISTYVFCYLSKNVRKDLIAPTYISALNGVYFVVVLVTTLVFMF